MVTVIIDGHHNRNQYFNRNFNDSPAKYGYFGLSPSRNHKGLNCRSYNSDAGLFPTPVKSKSFSEKSIKGKIAALSPQTPSPSIYFSADDGKNDRKVIKSSAVSIPMAMKFDDVSLMEDGDFVDGFYISELWAGPAYSNSPPPSSLPIPKFSMRPKRSVSLELPSSVSPIDLRPVAKSAPSSPTRERSPSPIHFLSDVESVMETSDQIYLQQETVDETDFATKTLRRILNLDNGGQ
ncbi:hypothetical protein LIER_21051 [Lithospermum erythrorhizon]|uniref:Uncharacterized protein n=1 Tax=Lithospermum erythrorhizon TaxID=34254 RepID=A0AAV3QNS3_LITER